MEWKTVQLSSLVEDLSNARKHNRRNLAAIKLSLETYGQVEALVVRAGTGRVLGGNGRLAVMRDLGWTEARICEVDLPDAQCAALALALNRTGDLAKWDDEKLEKTLREIGDAGLDSALAGFDAQDLEKLFANAGDDTLVIPSESVEVKQRIVCAKCGHIMEV